MIFLAAGFIQGLSGFGSALVAMPLLTMFIDVKIAVPLCILNSLLMTSYLAIKLKKHIEPKKIWPLLAGSIPGIYIGAKFLVNVDQSITELLLGLLIVSYCTYALIVHPEPRKIHKAWAYLAGFGTGFIGSAFSAGGPPSIIYTSLTDWSKDQVKATLTGFFFAASLITAAVHAASGLTGAVVLKYFFVSALFVVIGVYGGSLLYNRISRKSYIRIILIILMILGLIMSLSSLSSLSCFSSSSC